MSAPGNNGHYDVLWPRSPRQVRRKAAALAARLGSLRRSKIAKESGIRVDQFHSPT